MRYAISDLFFTDDNPALLRGPCGSLRQDDLQAGKTSPDAILIGTGSERRDARRNGSNGPVFGMRRCLDSVPAKCVPGLHST